MYRLLKLVLAKICTGRHAPARSPFAYSYRSLLCGSACLAGSLRPHADQVGEGGQPELLDLGRRHPVGLQGQGAQVLQQRQVVEARVGHPGVGHVKRHQRGQACRKTRINQRTDKCVLQEQLNKQQKNMYQRSAPGFCP